MNYFEAFEIRELSLLANPLLNIEALCFSQGFFNFIPATEYDRQFSIVVYFDTLDHLSDYRIIVLISVHLTMLDDILYLIQSFLVGAVAALTLPNGFDSSLELFDLIGDFLELSLTALNISAILNCFIHHTQHPGIQRIDASGEKVDLVRSTIQSKGVSYGRFHEGAVH